MSSKPFKPPTKRSLPTSQIVCPVDLATLPLESTGNEVEQTSMAFTQLKELNAEIKKLEDDGNCTDELQEFIDLLHLYNEYKDTAQLLMGQIAHMDGVPLKKVAQQFDAPANLE